MEEFKIKINHDKKRKEKSFSTLAIILILTFIFILKINRFSRAVNIIFWKTTYIVHKERKYRMKLMQ